MGGTFTTLRQAFGWVLDTEWGLIMYFVGNKEEAISTFGSQIQAWKDSVPDEEQDAVFYVGFL